MSDRRRLGRGLDALIPAPDAGAGAGGEARGIALHEIELNPKQPRVAVDAEKLGQLAESIRGSGVIQPVVVRPMGGRYELVVGERRVRAARMAGLDTVPALVRDVPDEKLLEFALVENIQRDDLNAIEKAQAVRRMISELSLTQEEAGRRLGLDRSTIANMVRLLELSEPIQAMVSRGTLTAGHARALLAVAEAGRRERLALLAAEKGLSVRQVEDIAAGRTPAHKAVRLYEPSPNVVQLEEGLSKALGARVEVKPRRKGGKIVIHFRDHDDFERLYEAITGESTLDYPRRASA
jgi:ParB family chromosome partitioning protein